MKSFLPYLRFLLTGFCLFGLICSSFQSLAHQAPYSIIRLDIKSKGVAAELELPLSELEFSFGFDASKHASTLVSKYGKQLQEYLLAHIYASSVNKVPWSIEVQNMVVQPAEQTASGSFQEIKIQLWMHPSDESSTRNFIFDYDVIMHEVINHYALISIRDDWTGTNSENSAEPFIIRRNADNLIPPFIVEQENDYARGFKNMFSLGMSHISEGTDHLLFLFALLLSAPLVVIGNKWRQSHNIRYSLLRILKVVTAFTAGHSLTLLIGAFEWVTLPNQLIEIVIAISILVAAFHALKPLFPGKEILVAGIFGLIHGLAFADTLVTLELSAGQMALSILGFNLGIELMQVFVILMIIPWLLLLATTAWYPIVKVAGSSIAMIAALAWLVERVLQMNSIITPLINKAQPYLICGIAVLSGASIIAFCAERFSLKILKR